MSASEIDEYLAQLEPAQRATLETVRRRILKVVPDAEQCISYKIPAFRVDGRVVAGFAAFTNHLSYLPFSGSVLSALASEIEGFTHTKSALHFKVGEPLSARLIQLLIKVRLEASK